MKKAMSKKGHRTFYVALGICMIAIAAAIYLGVSGMMKQLDQDQTMELSQQTDDAEWNYPTTEDVNKPEEDVAKEQPSVSMAEEIPSQPEQTQETAAAPALQFMMPLEGEVINTFSNGELVKSKTLNEWRTHDGVDLKAPADTPVKAMGDGTVQEITEDPMWGTCVSIAHSNNYVSFYKGLKPAVQVQAGQTVSVGEVIGAVGNTAEIEVAEDSHLHFGVQKDGQWVDPVGAVQQ